MEAERPPTAPSGSGQVSGTKRQGSPSASEHADREGKSSKSTKTEQSVVSPRKEVSHLTPPPIPQEEEGNPKHRMSLKLSGYLGHRIDIGRRFKKVTFIDIKVANLRKALSDVFSQELLFRLMKSRTMTFKDIKEYVELGTAIVVGATMKAVYARLRTLHFALQEKKSRYTERPSFPSEAEIPAPFASLVQGIGRIRIHDYVDDLLIAPTYPEGTLYEGAEDSSWTYAQYICIVEELKSLGFPFRSIVLKDTQGGSWWLYRDRVNEDRHELVMPFPVTNFSEHSAILRGLVLNNGAKVAENQIVNLDEFKCNYGTMLREVGVGDNLLYFRALCHDDESTWRPANE